MSITEMERRAERAGKFAGNYRNILLAIGGTVAAALSVGAWVGDRVAGQVEDALVPIEGKIERQTMSFNLLRCEIKEIPVIDCPFDEGVN